MRQQQTVTAIQEIRLPHRLAAAVLRQRPPRAALREAPLRILQAAVQPPGAPRRATTTQEVQVLLRKAAATRAVRPVLLPKAPPAVHREVAALNPILREAALRVQEEDAKKDKQY